MLPRINGGRPRTNEYLFDGISVLQPEPGQVAFFPIVDAIQEFKIESNSPPAEFGRFNGGVVNLTTKSGSNVFHGNVFEFFRNEALNARNFFQAANPVKPQYRRNQFGGILGGPLAKNRTFFFVDYQGQRQSIGRTVISTVPTVLQRQGIFTEAIAGRVSSIYDPRTDRRLDPDAVSQQHDSDERDGSRRARAAGALSAADFRRHREQLQPDGDRNRRSGSVGRAPRSQVRVRPGSGVRTPHVLPRQGSYRSRRCRTAAERFRLAASLGPQDTRSWAFASNYQHTFSASLLNELRIGDTRRTVERQAAELPAAAGAALSIPGIPTNAQFPNTLPTFAPNGYQQLGSPSNTASNFSTSVSEIADSLTWLKGRHTFKMGLDWRWERLNVIQPPSPTGTFTFSTVGSDLPGVANTGNPFASFLLGQVQTFAIDLQQSPIQERAHFQEYFIQDDWKVSDRLTINPGLRYTLNFPSTEINGQTAVFNLETQLLEYPGTDPVRPLKKNNFGPRFGAVYRVTDKTIVQLRLWPRLDRDGRHHDAVHDADVSVPAGRVAANARQHHARLRAGQRADDRAGRPDARPLVSARACSR